MLHLAGGQGKIAGKFNSDNGSGYFLSDGQGKELGTNEWIDFTWFGERSSIRSVSERRRVKREREAQGILAHVDRGYGSLQFTRAMSKEGAIEAAVIFHGQGKGMDQWFRGPKKIMSYGVAGTAVYRKQWIDLQKRWQRQQAPFRFGVEDDEGEWESDDESVVEVWVMDWDIVGARKDSMFSNRSEHVNGSRKATIRNELRDLGEWVAQIGSKELDELKELKSGKSLRYPTSWTD